MNITRTSTEIDYTPALQSGSVHVVAFAEEGFSFFKAYAEFAFGFTIEEGVDFCNRINRADETGTLWPRGALTALPKRYFRSPSFDRVGFRRCLRDAFIANRDYCKSQHMVFQFFCVDLHLDEMFSEIETLANTEFAQTGINQITVHMGTP